MFLGDVVDNTRLGTPLIVQDPCEFCCAKEKLAEPSLLHEYVFAGHSNIVFYF